MFAFAVRRLSLCIVLALLFWRPITTEGLEKGVPEAPGAGEVGIRVLVRETPPLNSIGRPIKEGPVFPDSPAPTVEEGEKQQTRIRNLIPKLGDDRLDVRDEATEELIALCSHSRAPLERATEDKNPEISRRAKLILASYPELTHVIVDAVKEAIPFAKVVITISNRRLMGNELAESDPDARVIGEWCDEYGRVAIPKVNVGFVSCVVQIQHPDYGWGRCQVWGTQPQLRFPLVPKRSNLAPRAVTGTVLAGNDPVKGALIQCHHLRTPGDGLINGAVFRGDALTDERGNFRLYLPNDNVNGERGDLIPPNSRYELLISKSDDESYFPISRMVSNVEPAIIELPRPARRHRFQFESAEGGWIDDPDQQRMVYVQFRDAQRNMVVVDAPSLIRGRAVLEGTYSATFVDNTRRIQFEPLVVTENSADELTFQIPKPLAYRGRVVHGITGEGIANAIVFGWNSTVRNNLALLTGDEWKLLGSAPSNPPADHAAMKLLQKFYGAQSLVRTDAQGQFEIVKPSDQEFYGLMAVDQNFLPFKVRLGPLKAGKQGPVEAGEFPLFPAAKVIVQPIFEGDRLAISPEWILAREGQPVWFKKFQAINLGSDRDIEYVHWLTLNEPQALYVPADIQLRLRFSSPYNDEWTPAKIENPVQLKTSASQDLGDLHFAPALPAEVLVVGPNGKPVEGFAIRRKYDSINAWCVPHNTDEQGIAFFFVHPNSSGQFRVSDLNGPRETVDAKNLTVDFRSGAAAPKQPFRIQVTEEQIALLRKSK